MKTRWKVQIPQPKSARMAGTGILVVQKSNGWCGGSTDKYKLPECVDAIFELSESYDWIGDTSVIDGNSFDVYVEYTNSTGSRKESARLIPEKVTDPGV